MSTRIYDHCTKIGTVRITYEQKYVIGIEILNTKKMEKYENKDDLLVQAIKQIDAYLLGKLKIFVRIRLQDNILPPVARCSLSIVDQKPTTTLLCAIDM